MSDLENNQVTPQDGENQEPEYVTKEVLEEFSKGIFDQLNKTITGAIGRVKRETTNDFQSSLQQQQQSIQELLGKLVGATPPAQDNQLDNKDENGKDTVADIQDKVQSLLKWRENQAKLAEAQAKRIQELEQAKIQAEKQAEAERIKNNWNKLAGDKVHAPDQLLQLALAGGDLKLTAKGQPGIETDELTVTGENKFLTGDDAITQLLSLPQYAHFRKGASGGGTGFKAGGEPRASLREIIDGIPLNETDEERMARIRKANGFS